MCDGLTLRTQTESGSNSSNTYICRKLFVHIDAFIQTSHLLYRAIELLYSWSTQVLYGILAVTFKLMNALLKIDSIMFHVSNLHKSTEFYEDVLCLRRVWADDERKMVGLVFPESDSEIVIHNDASMPNPSFNFLVADVEAFCLDYEKRGYEVIQGPLDVRCGKYAILADPDGNRLPIIDLTRFGNKPRYDHNGM